MFADADESDPQSGVRTVELVKHGPNCGFHLTRSKWDPYPWVSNVDENSVSSSAGLKAGDCLLEVNGEDVVGQRISEIADLVKSKLDKVSLLVWNAGVDPYCSPEALCCGPIPNNLTRLSACMSSILAFLECPVCLDMIAPPTYQCENGHLICMRCRAKSERCPVCRIRLTRGRSLISDQVYNAIIDAFDMREENNDSRALRIAQIFKPKTKSKNIPNIKITQCHTNKFLTKITGKSSSVENLSSNIRLLVPENNDLKMKSLSSNEIFQQESPVVSRAGSITRLGRRKYNITNMDDSLTNISDFGNRPASYHGSFEFLDNQLTNDRISSRTSSIEPLDEEEISFHCPFDSKCTTLIGSNVTEHFQTSHTGPLVQYFGPRFQIALKFLEKELCFMLNYKGNVFFVKIVGSDIEETKQNGIMAWCWHLGSKPAAKCFEMEIELTAQDVDTTLLRLRSSVWSLNTSSFQDILELKKGIFISDKTLDALGTRDEIILNVLVISMVD